MSAKILAVDDDPDMLEMLRSALHDAGYSVRTALNGAEALAKARRSPPDLIILDVVLPDVNGFAVCETLRGDPATASVPVLMMTVLPGEFPRLVGSEAGANVYLNKPFEIHELLARVKDLLHEAPVGSKELSAASTSAARTLVAAASAARG